MNTARSPGNAHRAVRNEIESVVLAHVGSRPSGIVWSVGEIRYMIAVDIALDVAAKSAVALREGWIEKVFALLSLRGE